MYRDTYDEQCSRGLNLLLVDLTLVEHHVIIIVLTAIEAESIIEKYIPVPASEIRQRFVTGGARA